MYLHKLTFLAIFIFSMPSFSSDASELKKAAQNYYIKGNYAEANKQFSLILNSQTNEKKILKYAARMKATLLEQYLAEIDSAIHYYSFILNNFKLSSRENITINQKLNFLKSLGTEKKAYGVYQKIIFTTSDEKERTQKLISFIKEFPKSSLIKNALKQCAVAGLNSALYKESYNCYQKIKENYSPLSAGEKLQYNLCKRMFFRYRVYQISIFIWLLIAPIIIFEILSIATTGISSVRIFIGPIIIWAIFIITLWILYSVKIVNSDHNPFRIIDMILMTLISTVSVFLNLHVNINSKNRLYKFLIFILTSLSILSASYNSLYNRSDRITVMEDIGDQLMDIIKNENNQKR